MTLIDPNHPIARLARENKRYRIEAYAFVFEALNYAQTIMGLGSNSPAPTPEESGEERHLTGQQLCEAIRRYAIEQYGYMSKTVLNSWGIRATSDFGEIVYNLIEIGQMRKSEGDHREDFDNVFQFDEAFVNGFKIAPSEKPT